MNKFQGVMVEKGIVGKIGATKSITPEKEVALLGILFALHKEKWPTCHVRLVSTL